MEAITIRPALPGDLDFIAGLEDFCFTDARARDMLSRQLCAADRVFLLAERAGTPLAFGDYQFVLDEGYIGNIAVLAECRRQGVGRSLVKALLESGREKSLSFLTLEVRESNAAARGLYEACGFETVATHKNYYEKPRENAVFMTAYL